MVNYTVDPKVLVPFVPRGTELDLWQGRAKVSLIGFRFLQTRLLGIPVPFHTDFEEVNLRFYVVRRVGTEVRRGVTFIREIVPKPAIAWTALAFYNEPYLAMPMKHSLSTTSAGCEAEYQWGPRGQMNALTMNADPEFAPMNPDSEEAFIAEHYWGYCPQRNGSTIEYQVKHPSWNIAAARSTQIDVDWQRLYGDSFAHLADALPASAFLAKGSAVSVGFGQRF